MIAFNSILKGAGSVINSRAFPYIVIAILALLFFRTCNRLENAKSESDRNLANYLAAQDSVRLISTENNGLLYEKAAFEKTKKELLEENSELVEELGFEKRKPPKVIIQTKIEYRDTIITGITSTFSREDSTGSASFTHEPKLPGENYFKLSGSVPYSLNIADSIAPVLFGEAKLTIEQRIDLRTGLFRDKKDKRLYVRVFTDYPNLTLNDVYAIDIADGESKSAMRAMRKPWGIGFQFGYGMAFSKSGYSFGPYFGIGLSYNPKFLQFGK